MTHAWDYWLKSYELVAKPDSNGYNTETVLTLWKD